MEDTYYRTRKIIVVWYLCNMKDDSKEFNISLIGVTSDKPSLLNTRRNLYSKTDCRLGVKYFMEMWQKLIFPNCQLFVFTNIHAVSKRVFDTNLNWPACFPK
jgi:hypothetical protein